MCERKGTLRLVGAKKKGVFKVIFVRHRPMEVQREIGGGGSNNNAGRRKRLEDNEKYRGSYRWATWCFRVALKYAAIVRQRCLVLRSLYNLERKWSKRAAQSPCSKYEATLNTEENVFIFKWSRGPETNHKQGILSAEIGERNYCLLVNPFLTAMQDWKRTKNMK